MATYYALKIRKELALAIPILIVLLIFGLVVWFIVKEPRKPGERGLFGQIEDTVKQYVHRP